MSARIAVLASGSGTNLQAIFEHLDRLGERRGGEVVVVASDRPDAGALARARARGLPAVELVSRKRPEGPTLEATLDDHGADLVVLAGYLRLVPAEVVRRWEGRVVNVHPALLPAFGGAGMYGARVHREVLASGTYVTGATVHFVDEEFDRGTIIAQWPVPVLAGDDPHTLAERVLRVEHVLYPRVVDALARGRVTLAGCRAGRSLRAGSGATFRLATDDDTLASEIERALAL